MICNRKDLDAFVDYLDSEELLSLPMPEQMIEFVESIKYRDRIFYRVKGSSYFTKDYQPWRSNDVGEAYKVAAWVIAEIKNETS